MKITLPESINFIINTLEDNGYEAYIVGGCVRDILLGHTPHDYDITTSARPEDIKRIFKKTVDTGIKHGTITVIENKTAVEVTAFRTESRYSDSRRPDSVNFVSDVKDDLARRDFTVNAICYNPERGLLDCFSGTEDIKNRILRAVGNPERRFSEDALRIMRLFRFAATLCFDIEDKTLISALNQAAGLKSISVERIAAELLKLSCGNNLSAALPLFKSGALKFLGIKGCFSAKEISTLQENAELRLFAILKDCCDDIEHTASLLKLSNHTKNYILSLNRLSYCPIPKEKSETKQLLRRFEKDAVSDYFEYLSAVKGINTTHQAELLSDIIEKNEPYKISQLSVSGSDLLNLGLSGEKIGEALEYLLSEVISSPELNQRQELLKIVCNIK